jgi:hypothetical protein
MLRKYCHPLSLLTTIFLYTVTAFTQTEAQQFSAQ